MNKKPIILIILFITTGIIYYQLTEPKLQESQVSRIIDGDTIETSEGIIRLKGINTPEKSMPFYQEAKDYLSQQVQNKTIKLESYGTDKYNRILAHIFMPDEDGTPVPNLEGTLLRADKQNINEQILKQGLGTLYYYEPDRHYKKLKQAEEFARLNQKGLWQKSPDENCIEIIKFKTDEPESLTLQNNCNKILNITFKDDATHIYQTTIQPKSKYTKTFSHIWNTDGDSIYIRDSKGLLTFHRY